MNFDDSPGEERFRSDLRRWLAAHAPEAGPDPADEEACFRFLNDWHRSLARGGWLGLTLPVDVGGRGLGPVHEAIFNEEIAACDAPTPPRNVGFLSKVLLAYGTPEQRHRFLPSILSCDEVWCQGFSEPGAGSDLGSLRTRAVLDGDRYVVNGQKVWTTFAKWADWCLLLARTDPEAPKHRGISALALRMDSPGVTVRPIHQINHSEELAEVFLDDVVVPADQLIGQPGDGWRLAMRTLAYERGPGDVGSIARAFRELNALLRAARGGAFDHAPEARLRLARLSVRMDVLRLHVLRSLSARVRSEPGPEGSIDKLLIVGAEQDLARFRLDFAGPAAATGDDPESLGEYLRSRSLSIYGGTAQIQKNIIAQRILGMPSS